MRSRRLLCFDLWYQPHWRDPSARLPQCFSGGFPLHSGVSPRPLCRVPAMPPIYNQGAPVIAEHRCHQPRIFGPACLDPETGIFPSSQQWRSSCLQVSSKVSYRRGRSRTVNSRSSSRGAAHRWGLLRCRNCQWGASSGPQVPPILIRPASSANCRQTYWAAAGRQAVAP